MKRSHAGHVEEEKINYSEVDESKTDDSKILLQLLSSDEAAVVQACNLLASRPPTENGKIIKAVLKVYEESESANLCAEAASTLHSWTVCSDFPNSRNICVRRLYANCTLPTLINYLPRATSLVSSLSRSDVPTEEKQKITIQHLTTSIILVIWAFVEEIPPAIDQLGKNAQGTLGSFVISVLEKRDFLGPSVILPLLSLLLALYDDLFADLMSNETDTGESFRFSPIDTAYIGSMLASIVSSSKSIDVEHTVSLESTNDIVAVMHTAVLADHLEIMLRTEKKVENQDHLISALNLVQTLLPRNESAIEMFRDICEILANEIALNSDSFSDLTYLIGRVTACIDFLLSCVINNPQKIEQVSCAIQRAFGVIGNGAFSFQDPSAIRGVFDWMLSSLETSISALHNIEVLRSYSEALRNINTAAISLDIFPKLQICELHANLLMEISNRLTDDETTASILPLVAMTCPTLLMSHTVIDAIRSNFCPGKSLFVLVSVAECIEEVNNANINLPPVLFDWIKNCRREVIGQFTRKDGTSRGLIENEVSQEQLKYVIEVLDSIKETPKCSEDTSSSFNSVTDR